MIESVASTVIARPVGEVFAFITDPANLPMWAGRAHVVKLSAGAFGDGTLIQRNGVVMRVYNFAIDGGFEVENTAIRFPASLLMRRAHALLRFETADDGTRFTTTHRFELTPLVRPLQRVLAKRAQRESQAAVERVKHMLEGR